MNNIKKSLIVNLLIFLLVLSGSIFMITGFQFMVKVNLLNSGSYSAFRYFTVDSNILVGIASLVLCIYEYLHLKGKIEIPKWVYVFKYIGTCAVALTFIITLFWLTRFYKGSFYLLYVNTNLFFHLIVPLLAAYSFIKYEKVELNKKMVLTGVMPMVVYGIYYVINILKHFENGKVSYQYDFYGFAQGGVNTIFFVFLFVLGLMYVISLIIYKLNKRG